VSGKAKQKNLEQQGNYSRHPPPIKITPRPGGKFLLEPLTAPPKILKIPPSPPPQNGGRSDGLRPTSQNTIEPRSFIQLVLSKARHARYAWGASLETGSATDCSGFTRYIYRLCKIDLPSTSAEQAQVGKVVTHNMDFSKLEPGDLLFFRQGGRAIGHAGIYIGNGKMVHATSNAGGVVVSELDQGYYVNNFVVAKRVFEKKYRWSSSLGLSPAARNQDWDSCGVTPAPPLRPLPVIASKLLKIFWPGNYRAWEPQV
jgi:hypothetical protein